MSANTSAKEQKNLECVTGNISRVTYHDQESGFAVLRVDVKGHKDFVTVTGVLPSVLPGEDIRAHGNWFSHPQYGMGFKADFIKSIKPNDIYGIEKYLGSGLIKGIGPHFAKQLVAEFKKDVFDIIENNIEKLLSIPGIGKKRISKIQENWSEQKIIREIMVFLQSNGIGTSRATKIYKTYKEESINIISANPYRLASDIRGIGFLSADLVASNLSIPKDSIIRARAGISHVMMEFGNKGHIAIEYQELIHDACKLMDISSDIVEDAISRELKDGNIVEDTIEDKDFLFLGAFHAYEKNIAIKICSMLSKKPKYHGIDMAVAIKWVEGRANISLAPGQRDAIKSALSSNVCIITGGPGTGKTTILNCILKILNAKKLKVKICAPTGRAAKRLSEATDMPSCTIHRLLQFEPSKGDFKYNKDNPLKLDVLVVDESSMIDAKLAYQLFDALPHHASILVVGDIDQLPSVGPGQVLKDMIDSNKITVAKLDRIYRQAKGSQIITNAHMINKGMMPNLNTVDGDFYFIKEECSDEIASKINEVVKNRLPKRFGFNPTKDIQVLCPMQRGVIGAVNMNAILQSSLNPNALVRDGGVSKYGSCYYAGDKVMQIENNYDKDVYNGDMGYIVHIDHENSTTLIDFDGREVEYDFISLDQIKLAYAITIHKSQGSQYPVVVIPMSTSAYMMLQKNLIYTGITRGSKLVIIIGQKKAIGMAINSKSSKRNTKLNEWIEYFAKNSLN